MVPAQAGPAAVGKAGTADGRGEGGEGIRKWWWYILANRPLWYRRSSAELLAFFFVLVLPLPAPDSAKAVQQGFQLHLLHIHGQQAIRHYLLRGGLLHPLPPDGAGLLPHLRHSQGARPPDPGAAARGGPHRRPAAPPGPAQHAPHED